MVSLIPVIEFEPANYSLSSRKFPSNKSAQEDPQAWDQYWRDSLMDAGINELSPIYPGSWFVAVSKLTRHSTLQTLLQIVFNDIDDWNIEALPSLSGGYVFVQNDIQIVPGCCGDLGNLRDWHIACESHSNSWQMVWIGHPWTHVSAQGELLTFLEPTEEDPPTTLNQVVTVERSQLRKAIDDAAREVKALADRLMPIVATFKPSCPVRRVVEVLIEGHGGY